jgi:hypothetical protein
MATSIRSHAVTAVIATATALLVTGAPAIARSAGSFVRAGDADTVNGFGAVGCHATVAHRSGKLVATCPGTGRLPNNIIAKAPNANLLDGADSTAFLRVGAKAADSERLDGQDSSAFLRVAGTAADSNLLDGIDSTGFMRRGIYRVTTSGMGTCPSGDPCFLRVDCQSGDTLLAGGFDKVDVGTRLIASRPGKDTSEGHPTSYGWVVWWDNNATKDAVEVSVICANN